MSIFHPTITEKQLQQLVRSCALQFGWRFYHPWMSVKSAAGFPDCTMVRSDVRGARLIFAELKTENGRLTEAQAEWINALGDVPGVEARVWRPADWFSGEIERTLR